MSLDIHNNWTRPVICVSNNDIGWNTPRENAKLLTVGKIYTLVDAEVHDWHTIVRLAEFPSFGFNSVLFEEVDDETLLTAPKAKPIPIRDNLLVTAGARAAYMHCRGDIDISNDLAGEDDLAEFITKAVDVYMKDYDASFDLYIEDALMKKYGGK